VNFSIELAILIGFVFLLFSRYNLRINGLLNIDAGIFQCMGTNPAGSVQASARLTVLQPSEYCILCIRCILRISREE